jgi:hypothetical protein
MKLVFRTVFFHFLCILVFSVLYYIFRDDYKETNHKKNKMIDFIFLSTTIQAGVGLTDIYPISVYGKLVMILQQIIMILTSIITVYIFTL